jgi:hypothetical protein
MRTDTNDLELNPKTGQVYFIYHFFRTDGSMEPIALPSVLYIKLGSNGDWEDECINLEQTLKVGYHEANHDDSLKGNWKSCPATNVRTPKKMSPKPTEMSDRSSTSILPITK